MSLPQQYMSPCKRARTSEGAAAMQEHTGEEAHGALLTWARGAGTALHKDIRVDSGCQGGGLVAVTDLAKGQCAIYLPREVILSCEAAVGSDMGKLVSAHSRLRVVSDLAAERHRWEQALDTGNDGVSTDDGSEVITQRSVLYAFLIHQRHVQRATDEEAFPGWTAYARSLPESYSTPFTWEPDELCHKAVQLEVEQLSR